MLTQHSSTQLLILICLTPSPPALPDIWKPVQQKRCMKHFWALSILLKQPLQPSPHAKRGTGKQRLSVTGARGKALHSWNNLVASREYPGCLGPLDAHLGGQQKKQHDLGANHQSQKQFNNTGGGNIISSLPCTLEKILTAFHNTLETH